MKVGTLVLLLALLATPAALAQGIPSQPCGPIDIPNAPPVPASPIGVGERVDITVEVVNTGPQLASVTVTAATTTAGWGVVASPPPADIAAGGTGRFVVTVEAREGASGDAVVTFAASGNCPNPLPVCPGTACNAGSANTQVQVPFRAEEGFRIPGLDAVDLPVEILIAAVVLVGLATAIPFAMRKKRTHVVAECPEPLKMVKAGRGTSFPIEVRNPGKEATTIAFEVGPVPEGWSAFMPLPEVQLAAQEARSLWLMVRAPASALAGTTVDVELRLRDARRGGPQQTVRTRAEVTSGGPD